MTVECFKPYATFYQNILKVWDDLDGDIDCAMKIWWRPHVNSSHLLSAIICEASSRTSNTTSVDGGFEKRPKRSLALLKMSKQANQHNQMTGCRETMKTSCPSKIQLLKGYSI